ncbi:shootin-1-like [Liolophura sinensis]|uniref:shootin-1-like n=1 Tax=Liolophura sinensis TaxID=3198878 RepID=UPI00315962BC
MEAPNTASVSEADVWKKKFEECEKTLSALEPLAADGVKAYDELLNKYNTNQTQYKKLQDKLQEKEEQMNEIKTLVEPMYNEYDKLQTRLSIETKCREEVETYASKLTKENKVLRRQSQAFLNKSGGAVPVEKEPDIFKEHCERMEIKIKELEEEITEIKQKLRNSEDETATQKERADKAVLRVQKTNHELERAKRSLKQHEQALQELANCSELAFKEYQSLRKKYDIEIQCRSKAEKYASQMYVQSEAMKRQSAILLTSVASDERLLMALTAVEEANEQLEELKQKHEQEVKTLEEQLSGSEHLVQVATLEEELSRLEKENEALQKKHDETNNQYKELLAKYRELESKYDVLTQPPPPPPLPVDFNVTKKNVTDIIKEKREMKQRKLASGGVKQSEGYAKAIDEMMNRIKGGQTVLKPCGKNLRRPSVPDETDSGGGAMEELHNIFSKMKKTRSEGDLLSVTSSESEDGDSELAKTFQKIRGGPSGSNSGVPGPGLPKVQEERDSQISAL